ncbi:MAG: putative transposase [Thermomicrobiales bacterium]|nr:putative transposase [Thermomicrobiales bacterium]
MTPPAGETRADGADTPPADRRRHADHTCKSELVERHHWPTRQDARRAIFESLEVVSNRQRLHSALGYLAPVAFEEMRAPLPIAA